MGVSNMGTFSRLRYVIAANVNALIEKAEDPEKLLRALIREMEDAGEETRLASAELLAEKTHLARLELELNQEAELWHGRAEHAVQEQRDDLARAALKAHAEVLGRHATVAQQRTGVADRLKQLEMDMQTLKSKLAEAKLKLKSGYARPSTGQSGSMTTSASLSPSEKRVRQALGRFDRLQTQVENLEARVRSYEVGGSPPAVWNSSFQATGSDPAVEDELQRLKQRLTKSQTTDQEAAA
jgi:phage shock protein A